MDYWLKVRFLIGFKQKKGVSVSKIRWERDPQFGDRETKSYGSHSDDWRDEKKARWKGEGDAVKWSTTSWTHTGIPTRYRSKHQKWFWNR